MTSATLIAASLAVLAPPAPQTPLAIGKSLAKAYAASIVAKDVSWLSSHTTPDFTLTPAKGAKQNRDALLAGMKSGFQGMKAKPTVEISVIAARRAEGGILVTQNTHIAAKVDFGKPQLTTIDSKTKEEVLYVPKGRDWAAKRMKVLKDTTTFDGKPFGQ